MNLVVNNDKPVSEQKLGPSHLVVTSWSPEGLKLYGSRFRTTFTTHWPRIAGLRIITDEEIYALPEGKAFFERHADKKKELGPKYDYRQDLYRFAHKIFALKKGFEAANEVKASWLIWLDGDVHTLKDIPEDVLKSWTPDNKDVVYLSRVETWDHPECGFMAFNLMSVKARVFLREYIRLWENDEVLKFRETHDSHVFGEMLRRYPELHLYDMCPKGAGLEAFKPSPLGLYLEHEKGLKKFNAVEKPPAKEWTNRYELLLDLVRHYKPATILEVGTWNGERAMAMATAAHEAGAARVHYKGYDLFESASQETDERELNVKQHFRRDAVMGTLEAFRKGNNWFTYDLTMGDTRQTLGNEKADFVFIDGGHSIETIRADYEKLGHNDVVVLDDWYLPEHGKPDVTKYGVNAAVSDAVPLHPADPVKGGGKTCLALKLRVAPPPYLRPPGSMMKGDKEEIAKLTGGAFGGNMILKTRNCRPEEELRENIKANWPRIKKWCGLLDAHGGKLVLVSGGPSILLPEFRAKIKAHYRAGDKILCVKHSHNMLLKMGVVPWGCVLLDPRPHEGPSTHGYDRKSMLARPHRKVKYFVASMVDPTVLTHLLKKNADVWGWNAAVGAQEHTVLPKEMPLVMGGSTAVMRGVSLGHFLGFRNIVCYGMDSCHLDPATLDHSKRNPDGSPYYFTIEAKVNGKTRTFWTDRDNMAQTQDITRLYHENPWLDLTVLGPGIPAFVAEHTRPPGLRAEFADVFGESPTERPSWWRRLMAR